MEFPKYSDCEKENNQKKKEKKKMSCNFPTYLTTQKAPLVLVTRSGRSFPLRAFTHLLPLAEAHCPKTSSLPS